MQNEFPSVGTIFEHRFELLEILGTGGLGTAFKARQLDADRIVVLKILHNLFSEDQEFKQRFLDEARILASISHANVVRVYHLGVSEFGNPFLVMEFVRGQTLREILNVEGRIEPLRAFSIAGQMCGALSSVHDFGIVHRDIKPENVLVSDKPETDTVKIIDFGLSRNALLDQKLTATGVLIGSPKYMSPEQCKGQKADTRADIYAVTVCLYEMLTGETPFDASSPIRIIYKQVHEPVDVLKLRSITGFTPALERLILDGMAKYPEKRIQSVVELQERLSTAIDVLAGQPHNLAASRLALRGSQLLVILVLCISLLALPRICNRLAEKQGDNLIQGVNSGQENSSREIKKLKMIVGQIKSPGKIQEVALQERYLNHLLWLGHEQMYSTRRRDNTDAEVTFSEAIKFCDCLSGDFSRNHQSTCYGLRGVSKRRQGKFLEADADFSAALKWVNVQSVSRDIKVDILFQRALLRIQTRNFQAAADDVIAAVDIFDAIPNNLSTMDKVLQLLDKRASNRADTIEEIAHTLQMMRPDSSDEAAQMVMLANVLARKMSTSLRKKSEGKMVLEFSRSLLPRIKGNERLRAETMSLMDNYNK